MRGFRSVIMSAVVVPFLVLAGCSGPAGRPANPAGVVAAKPDLGPGQIAPAREYRNYGRGLSLDGRLWLRGLDGSLASLTLPGGVRTSHFADSVIDLAVSDGKPVALRSISLNPIDMEETFRPAGGKFVLSSWTGNGFEDSAPFEPSEMPRALVVIDGRPMVLSPHRMIVHGADGRWRPKPLQGEIRDHPIAEPPIVLAVNGLLYIGHDFGEWGGGLQRLDPATGIVTNIERRDSKDLCAGPLNSDCDPVTGLIQAPGAPGCVLASTGLAHMTSQQGAILKLCGDQVSVVWEKAWMEQWPGGSVRQSEPFYGLAEGTPGEVWILGFRVLYRFDGTRTVKAPLPKPVKLGDVWISRAIPGHMMVYYHDSRAGHWPPESMPYLVTRE
ncbi:hypothetical protein QFZ27_004955 [Inquilinus ginsengisoli]|uniref:hypothetical protein n=1 Tax=Inquilinus ginsengisoli TaxID=363840 RepID=UPI003D1E8D87